MKVITKFLGASVLALGMSANLASAAEVTISEQNYGSVTIDTAEIVVNHSQSGTFSMNVSANHLSVTATDSNGRQFRCFMSNVVTYDEPDTLEKVVNIASAISEGDRVKIEMQRGVLPQKCFVTKVLDF
ncbi:MULTISPECIES: hypothetical protein [Pseudoalteromonas]|uniref:Uncharacterized protein n=1 Tax=Pseudoalteromonas obscura TaxID=3048491 RepID=A0ABT7EL02_9GAMM|nr:MULTISPECIES: hypothetical protein [Pseudoalteromonas]MBQ4837690.1 hypothetical protein [Pseudoalteromonas luteoviolacea]MDK2595732.1 hypothetical protein [Pseudoalteromonas sp. P94(2023)]